MVDQFSIQLSFLIFESVFCFLSALVYAVSRDPFKLRKKVVLSLNIACGAMLLCEYLFYVYKGSTGAWDILVMKIVNAAVYYLIVLLLLAYAMLVAVRLFARCDLGPDMPCRKRFIAVTAVVGLGLALVTVSQFTGIYYSFDSNHVYQRGPLFWLAALIPTIGALIVASIIVEHRDKIGRGQLAVLLSYLVLPMVGELFQVIFYGNSYLNICMGLSVLLMFFENMVHKEKEIVRASRTEVRTGLANETGYIEWLRDMKGKEELKDYAVIIFDLRKFSDVNRTYGVENGNRVLASFGSVMLTHVGPDEILGRQYGNQFIAIVHKDHVDGFLNILKGIDVTFTDVSTEQPETITLSARAGVYLIDRTDLDGEDILIFAGQALSEVKARETEDVVWLTQELIDSIASRKGLEGEIRDGLKKGEFIPYYQPKVNIKTGKMCGAEALSRWLHGGEVLFPGKFIEIMEANGSIRLLDMDILKTVCADIADWLRMGLKVPQISVNFSRRNLSDPDLAAHIDNVVSASGIPKELIEIEITESSDEFSIEDLSRFVDAIRSLGYKVSIDDFGSKSSSLSLLRDVSFDTLKIDKGFVDNSKSKDVKILTNIVRLASAIDMEIVAEGVEQKGQIETLDELGVDVIQGFYFDKALPKEVMTERLKSPNYDCEFVSTI
ncbi:diguanylate cyclase (GGDEF) domain-containing protein [Oscillospiraceae bacterium]|nr:diguanylate cyclase (GGDEF) domain-containing protein [Oscillospiraceae bacterium]